MKKYVIFLLVSLLALAAITGCSPGAVSSNLTATATPTIPTDAALVFTTQPGGGAIAGVAFPTQPVVEIRDANGKVVDIDVDVTIAITPGTGARGGFLAGTMQENGTAGSVLVNVVKGVATFNRLAIMPYGTGYTLTATSPGIKSAVSLPFDVSPAPVGSSTP